MSSFIKTLSSYSPLSSFFAFFAFFRGTIWNRGGSSYSRGIRIKMAEALKGVPDVTFGEAEKACDRACYRREMRRSVYCLCPRG